MALMFPVAVQQPDRLASNGVIRDNGPLSLITPGRGVTRRWRSVGRWPVRVQADLGQPLAAQRRDQGASIPG